MPPASASLTDFMGHKRENCSEATHVNPDVVWVDASHFNHVCLYPWPGQDIHSHQMQPAGCS